MIENDSKRVRANLAALGFELHAHFMRREFAVASDVDPTVLTVYQIPPLTHILSDYTVVLRKDRGLNRKDYTFTDYDETMQAIIDAVTELKRVR